MFVLIVYAVCGEPQRNYKTKTHQTKTDDRQCIQNTNSDFVLQLLNKKGATPYELPPRAKIKKKQYHNN